MGFLCLLLLTLKVTDGVWTHKNLYMTPFLKIQKFKAEALCRPVECTFMSCPLLTESLVQVLSDNVETLKNVGVLRVRQWLRGVKVWVEDACWEVWIKSGMFEQIGSLCENKSWKLCWDAWEPDIVSVVQITQTLPLLHQALVFGHIMTGNFLFI